MCKFCMCFGTIPFRTYAPKFGCNYFLKGWHDCKCFGRCRQGFVILYLVYCDVLLNMDITCSNSCKVCYHIVQFDTLTSMDVCMYVCVCIC